MTPYIFIAEDDPQLSRLFTKVLEAAGFCVEVAADGAVALQCLTDNAYQVAILDMNLPHVSGLQLLEAIRAQHLPTGVILCTGNHCAAASPEAEAADLILIKPFSPRELVQMVERLTVYLNVA